MSYEQYQRELAPPWHQTPGGAALNGAKGAFKDGVVDDLVEAVMARFARGAPEDALALLGADRNLRRFEGEGTEAYRARILQAFEFWTLAGTKAGLELALEQFGYAATVIEHYPEGPHVRHEFSVMLQPKTKYLRAWRFGEPGARWGDGRVWGVQISAEEVRTLRGIIRDVKPAHARLRHIRLQENRPKWGAFRWGDGTVFGGVVAVL